MLGIAENGRSDFITAWVAYQAKSKSKPKDDQDDKSLGPVNKHGRPYE